MAVSATKDFWIHPNALTITLNYFDDPQLIQTSMLAGSVILAYNKNYIGYDAAHNYREWKLQAFPTQLNDTCAYYVHAELSRDGDTAMIIYSPVKRDIEGRSFIDGAWDSTPSSASWFIYLGEISASVDADGATVERVWTDGLYTGTLATDQQRLEDAQGDWALMFQLNSATGLIDFLRTVSSATFNALTVAKNFIFGGHTFTSVASTEESGDEKKRNDATLPTTGYVQKEIEALDDHFLIKDGDDPQEVGGDVSFGGNVSVAGEHSVGGDQSIGGGQSVVGSQTIGRNQTIEGEQEVKGLQTLHEGFMTPNFNDAGGQVTGAQLTRDGLFSVAGLIANSFTIKELIYNVIRAQGGEYVFSPTVNIERCVYHMKDGRSLSPDDYYAEYYTAADFANIDNVTLILRDDELTHKGNPLEVGDIVYGYVNQVGESGQHATGGQCLMHVTAINELEVTVELYQIGDRGVVANMPPAEGMTIAQRGTEDSSKTERMTSFYISAESGSVIMLDRVQSPTLSAGNYGASFGKLPTDLLLKVKEYFSYIQETDPVVYARYGIFENLLQFDHLGRPIQRENNRGEWVAPTFDDDGAQINPYRNLPSYYDAVTYNGALWKCFRDMTTEEPGKGNGWLLLVARGDDGTSIKIKGEKPSASELPNPPEDPSDCYIVGQDLYVWLPDTREWHNAGQFKGDKGDKGDDGKDGQSIVFNLMVNTNFDKVGEDGVPSSWSIGENEVDEVDIQIVDSVTSGTGQNALSIRPIAIDTINQKNNGLNSATWYLLSFSAKNGSDGSISGRVTISNRSDTYYINGKPSASSSSTAINVSVGTNWDNYLIAFQTTDSTDNVTISFGARNASYKVLLLSKVKLEVIQDQDNPANAKATDWTPNEKDLIGKDGKDGVDGKDGKDAITFRTEPSAINVKCNAERTEYIESIDDKLIHLYASSVSGDLDINSYTIEATYAVGSDILPNVAKDDKGHAIMLYSVYKNPKLLPEYIEVTFRDSTTAAEIGKFNVPIIVSERGIAGPQGKAGAMLLPQGNYDERKLYTLNKYADGSIASKPAVYLPAEKGKGSYLVLEKDMVNTVTINGETYPADENGQRIEADNREYWSVSTNYELIVAEFLMANFAKFGSENGGIFYDRYLFSQMGTNAYGDYTMFDETIFDEEGNFNRRFRPSLSLDFKNGTGSFMNLLEPYRDYGRPAVIRIKPETGFNVYIEPDILPATDWTNHFQMRNPMVILPSLDDIGLDEWEINGAHITITFGTGKSGYAALMKKEYGSRQAAHNEFVLVCVDDSCLNAEKLAGVSEDIYYTEIRGNVLEYGYDNFIFCRGRRGKYVMMSPGSTLTLRPHVVEEGTGGKRIYWQVESPDVYEKDVIVYHTAYSLPTKNLHGSLIDEVIFHNDKEKDPYIVTSEGGTKRYEVYAQKTMLEGASATDIDNLTSDISQLSNPEFGYVFGICFACGLTKMLPERIVIAAHRKSDGSINGEYSEKGDIFYHVRAYDAWSDTDNITGYASQ